MIVSGDRMYNMQKSLKTTNAQMYRAPHVTSEERKKIMSLISLESGPQFN